MMYRLTKHRGAEDKFLHFAVFLIRDASFVEIEYQFGYTTLYVHVQILWGTFCLNYLTRTSKNEGIYPSSSKSDL
jgi:hypothetical protein